MTQTVFTVIAEVDRARVDDLQRIVDAIGADPAGNAILPLGGFDNLHFASLVLVQGDDLPPTLIFEHNVDGSLDTWLDRLVAERAPGLEALYTHCRGFPGSGTDSTKLRSFLGDHVVRPGAFHIGATGRSLSRITQEADLREAIERHIDATLSSGAPPADAAGWRSSIQTFVAGDPSFSWARRTPKRQTPRERWGHLIRLGLTAVVAVSLALVLAPVLIAGVVVLRIKERTDPVQEGPADPAQVDGVAATEDFFAQNHLASVIKVKPGLLRAVILPVALYVLNLAARVNATKGELAGIPSIHFAHWSRINGGRHLLFLSNFDGSWESYLGDFIDKASTGLTAVWSNTVEFPRTSFLLREGAKDGPKFRQWARAHQCPTAAWFNAYPKSTMTIIDNNSSIREGLFGSMPETEVRAWLRRL